MNVREMYLYLRTLDRAGHGMYIEKNNNNVKYVKCKNKIENFISYTERKLASSIHIINSFESNEDGWDPIKHGIIIDPILTYSIIKTLNLLVVSDRVFQPLIYPGGLNLPMKSGTICIIKNEKLISEELKKSKELKNLMFFTIIHMMKNENYSILSNRLVVNIRSSFLLYYPYIRGDLPWSEINPRPLDYNYQIPNENNVNYKKIGQYIFNKLDIFCLFGNDTPDYFLNKKQKSIVIEI